MEYKSTCQGKRTNDEDETGLEPIEPTQEAPEKTSPNKVAVMTKMQVSSCKVEIMDIGMTRLK